VLSVKYVSDFPNMKSNNAVIYAVINTGMHPEELQHHCNATVTSWPPAGTA
jgi:hypothetical protein